jgi:alpha-mannosidase
MLKLSVPTSLSDPTVKCEIPYGAIERAADGTEHVGQRWQFLESNGYGVGLINTGQYGFDSKDGELRLSILRSPVYCHGAGQVLERDRAHRFMDIGEHEITLAITFGKEDAALADTIKSANQLNVPAWWMPYFPAGPGDLPPGVPSVEPSSFVTVMPETVVVGALKRAENGDGIIIRLHESAGKATDTTMTCANGESIAFKLGPYEIKSFRVRTGTAVEEVDLLEGTEG